MWRECKSTKDFFFFLTKLLFFISEFYLDWYKLLILDIFYGTNTLKIKMSLNI